MFGSATTKRKQLPHPPFALLLFVSTSRLLLREVALDRLFYTEVDLRAPGVKVTSQQGPVEKGCVNLLHDPGLAVVWSLSAVHSSPAAVVVKTQIQSLQLVSVHFEFK